jgi:hypothetical protein
VRRLIGWLAGWCRRATSVLHTFHTCTHVLRRLAAPPCAAWRRRWARCWRRRRRAPTWSQQSTCGSAWRWVPAGWHGSSISLVAGWVTTVNRARPKSIPSPPCPWERRWPPRRPWPAGPPPKCARPSSRWGVGGTPHGGGPWGGFVAGRPWGWAAGGPRRMPWGGRSGG